jgi:hypothetical protein
MRSTTFFNGLGMETEQAMLEHNVPKGLKKILLERQLWIENSRNNMVPSLLSEQIQHAVQYTV